VEISNIISKRLAELHPAIEENLHRTKNKDEVQYNKRNNVKPPSWFVGQEVLITNRRVKPRSESILTRPRYVVSFFITDTVHNPGFGTSYRLCRSTDGTPLRNLISGSRLRAYTASAKRAEFHKKNIHR